MRTSLNHSRTLAGQRALTLVEMMITMGVFSLVVTGLLYLHMFGLRQDQLVESKLGASDQARKAFGLLSQEMRGCQIWAVGNFTGGDPTNFTPIVGVQQGNALQLFLLATNPACIVYYFDNTDPAHCVLKRIHTGDAAATEVASHLTNYYGGPLTFTAEDYRGTPITDTLDRRMVHFTLGFIQYQYPLTTIGSNCLYDFYKMEFRLTPHVPPGR